MEEPKAEVLMTHRKEETAKNAISCGSGRNRTDAVKQSALKIN